MEGGSQSDLLFSGVLFFKFLQLKLHNMSYYEVAYSDPIKDTTPANAHHKLGISEQHPRVQHFNPNGRTVNEKVAQSTYVLRFSYCYLLHSPQLWSHEEFPITARLRVKNL